MKKLLLRLADRQKWKCSICGRKMRPEEPINIDHVLSYAKGGLNRSYNRSATHYKCNHDHKGSSWPTNSQILRHLNVLSVEEKSDFAASLFFPIKAPMRAATREILRRALRPDLEPKDDPKSYYLP